MRTGFLLVLLILLFDHTDCFTQQQYTQMTTHDGLPSNLVYGVMEGSEGYLWLYTSNGIAKYDGYGFKIFDYEKGVLNADVWYLHEDIYQRKWIINSTSINFYIQNDSIKKLDLDIHAGIIPDRIQFIPEGLIYTDSEKILYAIAGDATLIIDMNKESKRAFESVDSLRISTESKEKIKKYLSGENTIIGIDQFLPKTFEAGQFVFRCIDGRKKIEVYKSQPAIAITENEQTTYWDLMKEGVKEINSVRKYDNFIVLDHTGGYLIYDIDQNSVIDEAFVPFLNAKLTRGVRVGNIFFSGSFEDGLIIYDLELKEKITPEALIQFVGMDEGSVYFVDNDFEIKQQNSKRINRARNVENLKHELIKVLKHNGKLFGFTHDKIYSLSNQDVVAEHFKDSIFSVTSVVTKSVEIESPRDILVTDSLWMYIQYNEIIVIDKKRALQWSVAGPRLNFYSLEEYQNTYLVGTTDGIYEIGDKSIHPYPYFSSYRGKKVNIFRKLGKKGLAIVSNTSTLNIYHGNVKRFEYMFDFPIKSLCHCDTLLYGQSGNTIFKVRLNDSEGSFAMTKRNISKFDKIQDIECNKHSLYIATELGYYKINHEDFEAEKEVLEMVTLELHGANGLLQFPFNISSSYNSVEIYYKALSPSSLGDINYWYRLLPGDSTFNVTKKLSVSYMNLASGDYHFQLFATDIHENRTALKEVKFTVLHPFYKQPLTYLYLSLLFSGLIYIYHYINLKRIKSEEVKKREYNKLIAEQKLKALRAQMNPHFIFNVLSSIQNAIQSQDINTADESLVSFANLIRKYLDYSEVSRISLRDEIELLKLYISVENLRFDSSIDVQFKIDPSLQLDDIYIPSMLIQPSVENAINHGLFYKKKDKRLSIKFLGKKKEVHIEIEDNGIGRDKSMENSHKWAIQHESKAIFNIERRIETLSVTENMNIDYDIIDKKDLEQKSVGTLVIIKFSYK